MSPEKDTNLYQLMIRGKLKPATVEAARNVHNATAGNSAGVAAARSLGDLSHNVYVPTGQNGGAASELLILDVWNNLDGLNQFFSNHDVQEGGNMIFTDRDPVVWMPARGAFGYHLLAPKGKHDRFVGVVRGSVHSHEQALAVHNEFAAAAVNQSRMAGCISHDVYFRLAQPGTPESLELLAVDVWMDAAGMASVYANPEMGAVLGQMFAGMPSATTWQEPAGEWVEW